MTDEHLDFLIVGAGIPGLLAANHIKSSLPKAKVRLLEASASGGGQYKSEYLEELDVWVDLGMHLYYESGIEEFDRLVKSALPENEWMVLEGNQKDVAGIFWRGELRSAHPYPDLRNQSLLYRIRVFFSIVFRSLVHGVTANRPGSARQLSIRQFGKTVHSQIIEPILQKLYSSESQDLDGIAMRSPELRRIALLSAAAVKNLSRFPALMSRIAYPDQLGMPFRRDFKQAAYYPKKLGFGKNVVDSLVLGLVSSGVELDFGTKILSLEKTSAGFRVETVQEPGFQQFLSTQKIIWCAPIGPLTSLVTEDSTPIKRSLPPGREKFFLTALMQGHNPVTPLYYFYVYDRGFATFRVTNYSAYSGQSELPPETYLLGVEIWLDRGTSPDEAVQIAKTELASMGLVSADTSILDVWVLKPKAPPIEPTIETVRNVQQSVKAAREAFPDNPIIVSGPLTKPGVFFLQDVLRDLHGELADIVGTWRPLR